MSEKIYCGKGKKTQFGIKMNICIDNIPKEHINEYQGKKYLKLNINEMRQVDQRGNTHTITVDTWKPSENADNKDIDKLPF